MTASHNPDRVRAGVREHPAATMASRSAQATVDVVCLVNIDSTQCSASVTIPLSSVSDIRHRPEEKTLTAAATSTLIDRRPTEAGPAGKSK